MSLFISTLIFFSTIFISCDNDGDTTPPSINLISPSEGATLQIGNEHGIHFEAEFSDNEMLASYSVEIHHNFDDHGHTNKSSSEEDNELNEKIKNAFSFPKTTWDISGKRNTTDHHHDIKIPANVTPGKYHLLIYCMDAAGNEAYLARNIILSNDVEDEQHDH